MSDQPGDATWLNEGQRHRLCQAIAEDRTGVHKIGPMPLKALVRNPHIWGLAIACSASAAASSSLSFWQPQLLKGFGLTDLQTGFINAIPYGLAAALGLFWGLSSDRSGERRWHTAVPLLLIASGFTGVLFASGSLPATVLLLSVILISYASFKGPFWAFSSTI